MAKLICMVCEHEEKVPMHCGMEMEYIQKGSFRKVDYLRCKICGHEMFMPLHCSVPMLYFDEDYFPISKPTKAEIEEMKKIYGGI
ncbi:MULTISPECIES: hypothetical protein [Sulfolobaceae]|uniref:hypothetical protein n=1 Tax=Sulfolobaceae TaxID=118883 RepID=UPI001E5101D9|nr:MULTISPECIES: hypothetical protein [unclassified Sulfolobus]